jgi:abhydrolase domain-containing protein 17
MELNSILFPAPPASYDAETFPSELIWIPSEHHPLVNIPCLLLRSIQGSKKILLFFHGNAEDVGLAYEMTDLIRTVLQLHVLVVEYPGYGMYAGKPKAELIINDAESVHKFVVDVLKFSTDDIFAFGRSIGSGPSTWLARFKGLGCLFLMSAYTSIRSVVKNIAGKLAQYLVAERFRNIDNIPYVNCPTLLIHGALDTLVPYSHSQELHSLCGGLCHLVLPKEMDHNFFDYYDDLLLPMASFLTMAQIEIRPDPDGPDKGRIEISTDFFNMPEYQPKAKNKNRLHNIFKRFNN